MSRCWTAGAARSLPRHALTRQALVAHLTSLLAHHTPLPHCICMPAARCKEQPSVARGLQGSMILHSGLKTPGHANYTHRPLFEVAQTLPFHLPEGTDSLGAATWGRLAGLPLHFWPLCSIVLHTAAAQAFASLPNSSLHSTPCAGQDKFGPKAWDIIIRGPSKLDQPDIQAPGGAATAHLRPRPRLCQPDLPAGGTLMGPLLPLQSLPAAPSPCCGGPPTSLCSPTSFLGA